LFKNSSRSLLDKTQKVHFNGVFGTWFIRATITSSNYWTNNILWWKPKTKSKSKNNLNNSILFFRKNFLFFRYYKKFDIPDLCRVNIGLDSNNLKFAHKNNTLIITVSASFRNCDQKISIF
jgi:hypothetical protein